MPDESPNHSQSPSITRWVKVIGIVIVLLTAVVGFLGYKLLTTTASQPTIPASIINRIPFGAYVPSKLPGTYKINPTSFSMDEEKVLVFAATDGAGTSIAFTEQAVPPKFNFNDFYQQNLTDAKTLDNVPYPSVMGKSSTNRQTKVLSIKANNTWIIVSTSAPLDTNAFAEIAKHITLYRQ